jgi:hypothetical protein
VLNSERLAIASLFVLVKKLHLHSEPHSNSLSFSTLQISTATHYYVDPMCQPSTFFPSKPISFLSTFLPRRSEICPAAPSSVHLPRWRSPHLFLPRRRNRASSTRPPAPPPTYVFEPRYGDATLLCRRLRAATSQAPVSPRLLIYELMNFVMCDTLRFVTQLSFHSFFIHTFKFVICDKFFILHPHR